MLKKKIWVNFERITGIELFTQKIVTKLSKIWVWDLGSGIQGLKRDRIPDPDPQHCIINSFRNCCYCPCPGPGTADK
jgi:hypothetical protein